MGEVIPLFKQPDNLRYLPGAAQIAQHPESCSSIEIPPVNIVEVLDTLIHEGSIDEEEACRMLDSYLENHDDSHILALTAEHKAVTVPDPDQLTLF